MDVDVLVAGAGTVGLATGLFLAHHGVAALIVECQAGPSIHPRATGIGQRTAELLREVGLDDAVNAVSIDMTGRNLGKITVATLAGADLSAFAPAAPAQAPAAGYPSPVSPAVLRGTCPQDRLDAVLLSAARERGAAVRYGTELVSVEQQDPDGVTAILDGPDGRRSIRARYLVAADGARSRIRTGLGIATSGPGALGRPIMNIFFRADLAELTRGYSFVACEITEPRSPGMLVTIDGEQHWVFHSGYDPDAGQSAEDFTPPRCTELIRTAIGRPDLDVQVLSVLPWRVRAALAERFRHGRVFLVGDAAHAIPPIGAFGMNTGIADAHNVAWKLAYALRGQAGPGLLDSYDAERRPVGALAVEQATLRLADPRLHWDRSPRLAAERARVGAVNAPIVHLGYRYASRAVVDPQPDLPSREDVSANLDGSPGSRVPHVWVDRDGARRSTLDLVESRFTVLTGADATSWFEAAAQTATRLGIDLRVYQIGSAGLPDPDCRWLAAAGITATGALLIRPDGFVAWRSRATGADPADDLELALTTVLDRVA
jgi:2-polyprenyl-6-methoxyphenol hydroxylase-like FAD-dependent oxidoreductase